MIVLNRWICPRSFSYPIKYKFWLKLHFLSTNFAHLQPTSIWNILYIKIGDFKTSPSSFCSVSVAPPGPAPEKLKMSFQLKAEKVALYVGNPLAGKVAQTVDEQKERKQTIRQKNFLRIHKEGEETNSWVLSVVFFVDFAVRDFWTLTMRRFRKGPQEVLEPFFCRNLLAAWKLWAPFPRGFFVIVQTPSRFLRTKMHSLWGWRGVDATKVRKMETKNIEKTWYVFLFPFVHVFFVSSGFWSIFDHLQNACPNS